MDLQFRYCQCTGIWICNTSWISGIAWICFVLKINFLFCVQPLYCGHKGWFLNLNPHQHLFPEDEKYMYKICSRSIRKCMILPQLLPPFSSLPLCWFFEVKQCHYLFFFLGWKVHVPSLVQIHKKMCDFASTTSPFPPFLAPGIPFSKWSHASICFQGIKNTCGKFGLDLSKHGGTYNKPTHERIDFYILNRLFHQNLEFYKMWHLQHYSRELISCLLTNCCFSIITR